MDFIFDGVALSDLGYVIAYDGLVSENAVVSGMTYNTIKPALYDVSRKVGHVYDANLTTTFNIIKNPCVYKDTFNLSNDDISELTKWLVRKQYKWFRFVDDNDTTDEVWFKVQNTVEKIREGEHIIGLAITVNANAPYGFTRPIKDSWTAELNVSHNIVVHSDEEGYIYPDITITVLSDNNSLNLWNKSDVESRHSIIKNVVAGEVITMRGEGVQQITSSVASHDLSSDFNYNFFRLCNQFGKYNNQIYTNVPCDITLSYRGIRKVGL